MSKNTKFDEIYDEIMDSLETSYRLMEVYDAMPHKYGDSVLYQVESHTIEMIGEKPGITAAELSAKMNKTPSACSQIVRKLKKKELVCQKRNDENNREYNLFLTEDGWKIYQAHAAVDEECGRRKKERLSGFEKEELSIYLKINKVINEEFEVDVKQAENIFDSLKLDETDGEEN